MNRATWLACAGAAVFVFGSAAVAKEGGRENMKDDSFLIEEAYNQEKGVAQHIFTWQPSWDHTHIGHSSDFVFNYTIELPIGGDTHQLSFTPMVFEQFSNDPNVGPVEKEGGWGDVFINYRYQLLRDEPCNMTPAVAPRFSVILPTGDEDRGLGNGEVGYQFLLPVSKELDPFAFHFNAGTTITPNVQGNTINGYNLGASAIWLKSYDFNFMLEFVINWNEELDDTLAVDHTMQVILNPGYRAALFTSDDVQWVVGTGVPIGLSKDAPDIGIFIYLSVEHAFRTDHD